MNLEEHGSDARSFVLNLRETMMGSIAERERDCRNWDALFYAGATPDKNSAALANLVQSRILGQAGNLFSPDALSFRIEYGPGTPDIFLQRAMTLSAELSRALRDADADLEFSDGVELALRHGCAFGQVQWEKSSEDDDGHFACDIIQQTAVGVLNEQAKSLYEQPAFMVRYSLPVDDLRKSIGQFRGTGEVVRAFDRRDGEQRASMNEGTRVVFGLNQPIGSSSTNQAGFINLLPRPPFIPSANSAGRQVPVDAIWIKRDDGRWATVFVVDGNDTIGTDRWRNFLALGQDGSEDGRLAKRHPFFQICPKPVKGLFFGRSAIADLYEAQDFIRRHGEGLDFILSMQEKPTYVGFGSVNSPDVYKQALRTPGDFIQETGPQAKVQPFVPTLPPEMFQALELVGAWASDASNAPPVVQGRGEQGVRAGAHAETLLTAASARERRPALRVVRQCGDMGDIAFDIFRAKSALSLQATGGAFTAESMPDGYHVYCNGHTASPIFAAEYQNQITELARVGAIGPEEVLDLVNPSGLEFLRNRLKQREAAQQALLQEVEKNPKLAPLLGKKR